MPILGFALSGSQYLLIGLLAIAAIFDVMVRRVPNTLVGIGMLSALTLTIMPNSNISNLNISASLLGGLLGLVIFYYPYAKGYLGAGDTKLFVLVGMFLGPSLAAWAFLFSCLAGGMIALPFVILRSFKRVSSKLHQSRCYLMNFPYAIPIFIGTTMSVFHFQDLLN